MTNSQFFIQQLAFLILIILITCFGVALLMEAIRNLRRGVENGQSLTITLSLIVLLFSVLLFVDVVYNPILVWVTQ